MVGSLLFHLEESGCVMLAPFSPLPIEGAIPLQFSSPSTFSNISIPSLSLLLYSLIHSLSYRGGPEGYAFTEIWEPELWNEEVEETEEAKLAAACAMIKQKAEEARAKKAEREEENKRRIEMGLKPLGKEEKKVTKDDYTYEDMYKEMEIDTSSDSIKVVKEDEKRKEEKREEKKGEEEVRSNISTPTSVHSTFTRRNSDETETACTTPGVSTPKNEVVEAQVEMELIRKKKKTTEEDSEGNTPTNGLSTSTSDSISISSKGMVGIQMDSRADETEKVGNEIMGALVALKRKEIEESFSTSQSEKDTTQKNFKIQRSNSTDQEKNPMVFNFDSSMLPTSIQPGSHAAVAAATLIASNEEALENLGLCTAPLPIGVEMSEEEAFPFPATGSNGNSPLMNGNLGYFSLPAVGKGFDDLQMEEKSNFYQNETYSSLPCINDEVNKDETMTSNLSNSPNSNSPCLTRRVTLDNLSSLAENDKTIHSVSLDGEEKQSRLHKRAAAARPRPKLLVRKLSEQIMNGSVKPGMGRRMTSYGMVSSDP